MAANVLPIYAQTPHVSWGTVLTANTAMDGTGTVVGVFTGGANGSFLQRLRIKCQGASVQTVLRVFLTNASGNATAANNTFIDEITIPVNAASANSANPGFDLILNLPVPAGYTVNITIGTTVATNLAVTAIGGDY